MTIKEKLDAYWNKVNEGLETISSSNVLPLQMGDEVVTVEDLRGGIGKLRDGIYTIAVCGCVKAGKSTLLNSWLFEDSVLPVFDTPMTAKLTFIKYAEGNPHFEVEFYDKEEWQEILGSYAEEGIGVGRKKELDQRLEKCAARGASIGKCICSPRRENYIGRDLKKDLPDFISDPMSPSYPGKYTPFVKSVTIYIDHPRLKGIQIVDTPGLNDSNDINSRETRQWVREAHAVIYVLEVRGASQADVEFFQCYFPSNAAKSRIFVQNKIDSEPGFRNAKDAIKQYGQRSPYRELGLFGSDEVICSYSALVALINSKRSKGVMLTEDEQWQLDNNIPEDMNPDPDDLEAKVVERLFKNEGENRIETASSRLVQVYQVAIEKLERDCAMYERQIPDCEKNVDELTKEIEKHEQFSACLEQSSADKKAEFDDFLRDRIETISRALGKAQTSIIDKVRSAAGRCGVTDSAARACVPLELELSKRNAFLEVRQEARAARKVLRERLIQVRDSLSDNAVEAGIMDKIVIPPMRIDIEERLEATISGIGIDGDALYDKLPGRIMKFITGKSDEECVGIIIQEVLKVVQENIKTCRAALDDMFTEAFDSEFRKILLHFKEYCDSRKAELKTTRENLATANDRKKELADRLDVARARLDELKRDESSMRKLLGVAV